MSINQVEAQAKGTRQGLNKRTQLGRNQPAIYLHGPGKNERFNESFGSKQRREASALKTSTNPLGRSRQGESQAPKRTQLSRGTALKRQRQNLFAWTPNHLLLCTAEDGLPVGTKTSFPLMNAQSSRSIGYVRIYRSEIIDLCFRGS